jgi:hypothetical protein
VTNFFLEYFLCMNPNVFIELDGNLFTLPYVINLSQVCMFYSCRFSHLCHT